MKTLLDIVHRAAVPVPWSEGDNIPWNDPAFSARMLKEHLSETHDAASRSPERIKRHTRWIHREVLKQKPSRILDLGCGPGLYTSRLAAMGHDPWGIDFSPASVEFANKETTLEHRLGDIRVMDYGENNDLVMMLYGEINSFKPSDILNILTRARSSLAPDGKLLLEVHAVDTVERMGTVPQSWRALESGLFSDRPHILLEESFWDDNDGIATVRYIVIDAATSEVTRFAQSIQFQGSLDFEDMFAQTGLRLVTVAPSLGERKDWRADFFVIIAESA